MKRPITFFEERACELLLAGAHDPLIAYETLGRDAIMLVTASATQAQQQLP